MSLEEEKKPNKVFRLTKQTLAITIPASFNEFRNKYAEKKVVLIKTEDGFAVKPLENELAIVKLYRVTRGGVIVPIPIEVAKKIKIGKYYMPELKNGILYFHEVKENE